MAWVDIDKYMKINGAYKSSSAKETQLNKIKNDFKKHFADTLNFEDGGLLKINGIDQQILVTGTNKDNEKKIIAYPNETFYAGNIIDCYDKKWLVTKVDANKQVYTRGTMGECNLILKWQNKLKQIISKPCIAKETSYNSEGLSEGKIITVLDKIYSIQIPYDDDTKHLYESQRFILEVMGDSIQAYSLTKFNSIEDKYDGYGVLNITLSADQYNPSTDNAELMIANYQTIEVVESPSEPIYTCNILYDGELTIKVGGDYKIFSGVFYDLDGVIIDDIVPLWQVLTTDAQEDQYQIKFEDNNLCIKFNNNYGLIGTFARIMLSNQTNNSTKYVDVKIVGLF